MNNVVVDLRALYRNRSDQPSYHLASEDHLRIQVFNLLDKEKLGDWMCDGSALITVIGGEVVVSVDGQPERASELCQAVIPPGRPFRVTAENGPASVQIVWSPPFAKISDINM